MTMTYEEALIVEDTSALWIAGMIVMFKGVAVSVKATQVSQIHCIEKLFGHIDQAFSVRYVAIFDFLAEWDKKQVLTLRLGEVQIIHAVTRRGVSLLPNAARSFSVTSPDAASLPSIYDTE